MSGATPQNPGLVNWLLILSLGIIWGAAFMAVAVSLEGYGPLSVAAGRTALGALTLVALGKIVGQGIGTLGGLRAWAFAAAIGSVAVALPFFLLSWGIQHVPSAFAGVAMGAGPLLVLLLVYFFSPEEGIGPRRIAGIALGFVGLAVLVGPGAFDGAGGGRELAGRLACLGASGCYAVGSVLTRRSPPVPPVAFAAATLVVAAIVLSPVALALEGLPSDPPPKATAALVFAALFPTALASFIRVRVIKSAGSVFMSLTSYMVPVWAVIFGIVLLGEELPPQLFVALALILAGIALSQWRTFAALLARRR